MQDLESDTDLPDMAIDLFGDCVTILEAVASSCEEGFESRIPAYFESLTQIFGWVHGSRYYPDPIDTFDESAPLGFEPEILGEKWILGRIWPLMAGPLNRSCLWRILCTQLLRCDAVEFDRADLVPAEFVHHCINLYVTSEFHDFEYLDFSSTLG